MTFMNSLRFGLIYILFLSTAFYFVPTPDGFLSKLIYVLIVTVLHVAISYFLLGKEKLKKRKNIDE